MGVVSGAPAPSDAGRGASVGTSIAVQGSAGSSSAPNPGMSSPLSAAGTSSTAVASAGTSAQQNASTVGAAGQGASASNAASTGVAASKCPPGQSEQSETCDGLDNDCDGAIDEMLMEECGSSSMEPCRKGMKICNGGVWGECVGAVEPQMEICDAARVDENCNGAANEGCQCTEGEAVKCGKTGGICKQGTQQCTGGQLSMCSGAVDPMTEVCEGSQDEDCDGKTDEGCECTNGEQGPCMPTGACAPGMRTCKSGKWGQCSGAVVCTSDKICQQGQCVDCMNGATRKCGKDLPLPCHQGTQTCRNGQWDTQCVDEKGPSKDVCNGMDDDCDGRTDNGCPSGQDCVKTATAMACSLPLPNGSYRNSCQNCTYDGTSLHCDHCDTGTGGSPASTLTERCTSGQSIANCYGRLGCRDTYSAVQAAGSYDDSCTGCSYDDCSLHCTSCQNGSGVGLDTTTQMFPCPTGITNCLGKLVCGGC